MISEQLTKAIENHAPFGARIPLMEKFTILKFRKNQILLSEGQVPSSIYFVAQGLIRSYYLSGEGEVTWLFADSGEFMIPSGFFNQVKSTDYIEVLETCLVYELSFTELIALLETVPDVNTFVRNLLEKNYLRCKKRDQLLRINSSSDRYSEFINTYPGISEKATQEMLASFLNISRKHLSRVRNKNARKKD